jgi:calpain family cysteine protease
LGNVCPAREPLPKLEDLFRDYAKASKDLYKKGAHDGTAVHPSDVVQGQHADCFLMAAMAAVAQRHPDPDRWMRDMITPLGDGRYKVTFYEKQKDGSFTPRGVLIEGAFFKEAKSDEQNELWPAVIEKAYAQEYGKKDEAPYGFGRDGGRATEAMERLTGTPSQYRGLTGLTIDQFAEVHSREAITLHSLTATGPLAPGPGVNPMDQQLYRPPTDDKGQPLTGKAREEYDQKQGQTLAQWHVYYVDHVDRFTGTVVVHNVWDKGRQNIVMPYSEFQQSFQGFSSNPVK